jgi:putative transposase
MQRVKCYKFKFRHNAKFEAACNLTLDLCRELYNSALQERRDAYQINFVSINYHAQAIQLPEIKEIREDVGGVYSQVLQDVLRRVEKAFAGFFRRVKEGKAPGYPRFKPASRYDSFTYPQSGFRLAGDRLHLSKIGSCRIHLSRPIEGTIKTCTIKREVECWYVSFAVEENQCRFYPKTGERVGIDVGIENFATLSTGEAISNPKYLRESERELKTAQRRVARRSNRRSKRRGKAVKLLAKKHQKIARQRADFHHKTALKIVQEFDRIAVEDLNVKGMVKNHHLAKGISDAGWGQFTLILTSKAESAGREAIKVNPSYTSQDCSKCGARVRKTLATREHRCISCGLVLHRDHNAARNIEKRGALASGMVPDGESCEPRIPHYNAALGV